MTTLNDLSNADAWQTTAAEDVLADMTADLKDLWSGFSLLEDDQFVFAASALPDADSGAADLITDMGGTEWTLIDLAGPEPALSGALGEVIADLAAHGDLTIDFAAELKAAVALIHADYNL